MICLWGCKQKRITLFCAIAVNISKYGCSYIGLNLLHKYSSSVNILYKYNFIHTFASTSCFPKKWSYLNIYTKNWWVLKHILSSDTVSHSFKLAGLGISRAPIFGDGEKRIVGKTTFLYRWFKSCSLPVGSCGRTNRRVLSPDGFPIPVHRWHLKLKHSECWNYYLGKVMFLIIFKWFYSQK